MPRPSKQPKPVADPDAAPPGADAAGVVQVKVWLLGISPMVWRRLLVPDTCSLRELHGIIQVAMGWEGHPPLPVLPPLRPLRVVEGVSVVARHDLGRVEATPWRPVRAGGKSASAWLPALLERKPRKLAAVALANTGFPSRLRDGVPMMARIVWAMMATGEAYRGSKKAATPAAGAAAAA